jgi:hypothetical protein
VYLELVEDSHGFEAEGLRGAKHGKKQKDTSKYRTRTIHQRTRGTPLG